MPSHFAIDATMTPDNYLLLHESITCIAHRVSTVPRHRDPQSSMCRMKHRSTKKVAHWSLDPVYAFKNEAPKEETDTKAPSSSDLLI